MENLYLEARASEIEGTGCFAKQRIPAGTRIIEYLGQRIPQSVVEERSMVEVDDLGEIIKDSHVYMFYVDWRTTIDGAVNGNDARFINHSCAPNCKSTVEDRRVFIDAIRDIAPGEELTFDYKLDVNASSEQKKRYACRCKAPNCRGTMLALPKP
ncbi:MAG: SET domain-containing protein [Oxalobacter sp.]|nr:MAG: SET domain-containing protein [Oxalobacter sp.]